MIRGLQAIAVVLSGLTLLGGAATGGIYSPPPGDERPVWSPDASVIVHLSRRAPGGFHIINRAGRLEGTLPDVPPTTTLSFSPDWARIAYVAYTPDRPGGSSLVVSRPDGSQRRVLIDAMNGTAWSPDGTRIVFSRSTDRGPFDLWSIGVDGSGLTLVAQNAYQPEFSPDGFRLAFIVVRDMDNRRDLVVAPASGGLPVVLTRTLGRDVIRSAPTWSPDGSRVAFAGTGFIAVGRADGSSLRRYLRAPSGNPRWSPDGRSLLLSAPGVFRLDLSTGRYTRLALFGTDAAWSPDGSEVAFAGGGECKDRFGVYRVSARGRNLVRLTNDCRIRGTPGHDSLRGTDLADIVLGLGGNDHLAALDGAYQGDDLYGGPGDDTLVGDFLGDLLDGGPGSDRLDGRPGPDTLRGGPGRDVLNGAGGRDVIFSEDGERDTVACGTNSPSGGRDLDTAHLDRLDRVTGDCELLYRDGRADLRRGRTAFKILVWPSDTRKRPQKWTLRCNPVGGTLPDRERACRLLATMRAPLAPVAPARLCGPGIVPSRRARIEGSFAGKAVLLAFYRFSSCELERWNRHRFLLEPR